MLRQGRFRHRLLDEYFLNSQTPLAKTCLDKFLPLWRQKKISDVEIAGIYILIFSFLRRPKDFLGGPHRQMMQRGLDSSSISGVEVIELLRSALPEHLQKAKSLDRLAEESPFLQTFCELSWRSIPLAVAQSLMAWQSGRYPLQLMTYLPTPDEVLFMQTQGRRCVSMLIAETELQNFVAEGRDVLGFIVHDLIHADHFFADSERAQDQVQFCKKLWLVRHLPQIESMLNADPIFRDEFHYLMSDMNSVPLHLLKTLKAILLGFYKRQRGLTMRCSLPLSAEIEFSSLLETVLSPWQLEREALSAAHRLNTTHYRGSLDANLLHQALTINCYAENQVLC